MELKLSSLVKWQALHLVLMKNQFDDVLKLLKLMLTTLAASISVETLLSCLRQGVKRKWTCAFVRTWTVFL